MDDRLGAGLAVGEVVAVEGDVEVAERHLGAGQLADQGVQAAGEDGAAGVDADERERPRRAGVLLDDLVRDPHQRAAQIVAVEDDLLGWFSHARPFLASLDRVKGTDATSLAAAPAAPIAHGRECAVRRTLAVMIRRRERRRSPR